MGLFDVKAEKPNKVSIDFPAQIFKLMQEYKARFAKSNSTVVTEALEALLPLTPSMRRTLRDFCMEQMADKIEELQNNMSFSSMDLAAEIAQWKTLGMYFDEGALQGAIPPSMTKVLLKDGYAIFPKDNWIILGNVDGAPKDCMYAGVVECRNSSRYGENGTPVPHFVFFTKSKYANEYSNELEAKVYAECAKKYSRFTELFNMQATGQEWSEIDWTNPDDLQKANRLDVLPQFGLFNLPEKGDPIYWNTASPNYYPPCGAMVVRSVTDED